MEKAIIRRTGMRMWSGKELVRLWVEKLLRMQKSEENYIKNMGCDSINLKFGERMEKAMGCRKRRPI